MKDYEYLIYIMKQEYLPTDFKYFNVDVFVDKTKVGYMFSIPEDSDNILFDVFQESDPLEYLKDYFSGLIKDNYKFFKYMEVTKNNDNIIELTINKNNSQDPIEMLMKLVKIYSED